MTQNDNLQINEDERKNLKTPSYNDYMKLNRDGTGPYGLAISATEGFFTITKNVNSIVSGNFEAKGIDLNKDVFLFKGYFLNAKINPEKI